MFLGWVLGEYLEWVKYSNFRVVINVFMMIYVFEFIDYKEFGGIVFNVFVELVDLFLIFVELIGIKVFGKRLLY